MSNKLEIHVNQGKSGRGFCKAKWLRDLDPKTFQEICEGRTCSQAAEELSLRAGVSISDRDVWNQKDILGLTLKGKSSVPKAPKVVSLKPNPLAESALRMALDAIAFQNDILAVVAKYRQVR